MKTLVIVRHGAFDHSGQQIADVDRPLNREGRCQVEETARQFDHLNLSPDLLVSSAAKRVVETAEVYAKKLDVSSEAIRIEENIFEAERAEILRVVQSFEDDVQTAILFGHHPGVTDLLHHLVDSEIEKIPLGGFVVLELFAESWRFVSFKKGRLLAKAQPKGKASRRFAFWRR